MCQRKIIKNIIVLLIFVIVIFIRLSCLELSFASSIIEDENGIMYLNDYGEIAKDMWVWIDTDKDSIAECYRFDELGHIAINYKDKYGRETNELGQAVENGKIIQKMLSSGEILNNIVSPDKGVIKSTISIISPKPKYEKDKWTNKKEEIKIYETNGIEETIDGKILYAKNSYDEIDILGVESAESGIIYSNGKSLEISDEVKEDKQIVAGKDFRRFITSKNKCTEKVNTVYIYGGTKWTDVLSLNGNGAIVKFTLNGNNYIRFEVAHNNHSEEENTNMTLDMYVDGKFYDSFDEFVDGEIEVVEEYLENAKEVELRVNIASGSLSRIIYIKNGRLKKVKIKE